MPPVRRTVALTRRGGALSTQMDIESVSDQQPARRNDGNNIDQPAGEEHAARLAITDVESTEQLQNQVSPVRNLRRLTIPVFTGDTEIGDWLLCFEAQARGEGWTLAEMAAKLVTYLGGLAATLYLQEFGPAGPSSFQAAALYLREEHQTRGTADHWWKEAFNAVQTPGELPRTFYQRLRILKARIERENPSEELWSPELMKQRLLGGLRHPWQGLANAYRLHDVSYILRMLDIQVNDVNNTETSVFLAETDTRNDAMRGGSQDVRAYVCRGDAMRGCSREVRSYGIESSGRDDAMRGSSREVRSSDGFLAALRDNSQEVRAGCVAGARLPGRDAEGRRGLRLPGREAEGRRVPATGLPRGREYGRNATCFKCGQAGHMQRNCRSPYNRPNEEGYRERHNRYGANGGYQAGRGSIGNSRDDVDLRAMMVELTSPLQAAIGDLRAELRRKADIGTASSSPLN